MKANATVTLTITKEQAECLEWFLADRLDDWDENVAEVVEDTGIDVAESRTTILSVKDAHALLQAAIGATTAQPS